MDQSFFLAKVIKILYGLGLHDLQFCYSWSDFLSRMTLKKLIAAAVVVASASLPMAAEAQYGYSSGDYFGWGRGPRTQTYQRSNGWSSGSYFGSPRRSTGYPSGGSSSYGGLGGYRNLGVRDCSVYIRC